MCIDIESEKSKHNKLIKSKRIVPPFTYDVSRKAVRKKGLYPQLFVVFVTSLQYDVALKLYLQYILYLEDY